MSSALFALPTSTISAAQPVGKSPRKRKRWHVHGDAVSADSSGIEGDQSSNVNQGSMGSSRRGPVLTPDEIYQYRIAGQPFDQELPGYHFPHSSGERADRTRSKTRHLAAEDDLPGGYAGTKETLRQQHLAVITAILHRCILERDFERAGRALGLILHDEIRGHAVDIRSQGRWGIGAEILMRKGQDQHSQGDQVSERSLLITRPGFELARRYYERLIIQYPFHKAARQTGNADERDFSLALINLWIYIAHQDGKIIREGEEAQDDDLDDNCVVGLRKELAEARDIAQRLDDMMLSPLYSEHADFIRLRAMVALWVADMSRELDYLEEDIAKYEQPMNLNDRLSVESSLADGMSEIELNEGRNHSRRRPGTNREAEESQRKADELLNILEARLEISDDSDDG